MPCKEQGKLDEAVACYRRALELRPDYAEAHNNLGVAFKDQGKLDEAVACWRRALELEPDYAEAHGNLGVAFKEQGKLDEAVACCRRAVELKPDDAEAHNNLGVAFKEQGKLDEAVACYRRALELEPGFAEAHNNLGVAFKEQGKLDEAVACYRRALELEPGFAKAHNNLGNALKDQGKLDEAVACYRRALELKPDCAEAHSNLGNALKDQGKLDEAVACHRRALELKPDCAEVHSNLGSALKKQGKLDEAVACFRRAVELKPDHAEAHLNLGAAFKDQAKLDEALACFRRALELKPDYAEAHSNLLYTLIFCPGYDARTLYEEHRRWDQRHAAPLARFIQPHRNDRSPDRRLKIGYVSPDFRSHSAGLLHRAAFLRARPRAFEIVCYADVVRPDGITARLRSYADAWRNITGLDHEQVAQRIRRDGIDILVDLTMHMARNRLLVFARKPAPVQVCWLAYPGTTGVSAIDYRITDPYLDPPGPLSTAATRRNPSACRTPSGVTIRWTANRQSTPCRRRRRGICHVRVPQQLLQGQSARPEALGGGPQGRRSLPADDPGRRRNASPARAGPAGEGRGCPRSRDVRRPPAQAAVLAVLPRHRHRIGYASLQRAHDQPGLLLDGRAGRDHGGADGRGASRFVPTDESRPAGTDRLQPRAIRAVAAELAQDIPRLSNLRATLRQRMQSSPLMDAPRFAQARGRLS